MSWDSETEPEFQAKLDWAGAFVREEVEPHRRGSPAGRIVRLANSIHRM
jgi:hypothetical protein